MMIRNVSILFGIIGLMLSNISHAQDNKNPYDPYRVLYYLDGYKCMLATTNPKDIPNSPLAPVYETPDKNAKEIGNALLHSLVNIRVPQINDRQAILRPDGSTGWVDVKDLYPLSESCYGMVFANGRHGFGPTPPPKNKN